MTLLLLPSPWKTAGLFLISAGFTAIGALMIVDGKGLRGWFVALFFGLCLAVSLVQLWPGASYLKLTPTGFACCSLFRRWPFVPWDTVSEFGVSQKRVAFNRIGSASMNALPDTYGRKPEELAELMNDWRRRALELLQQASV